MSFELKPFFRVCYLSFDFVYDAICHTEIFKFFSLVAIIYFIHLDFGSVYFILHWGGGEWWREKWRQWHLNNNKKNNKRVLVSLLLVHL